mgnify:CR=1 FL=1
MGSAAGLGQEEAQNRNTYVRIRDDARRWEAGAGSLWEDPGLTQARLWWDRVQAETTLWARRYGDGLRRGRQLPALRARERRDRALEREKEEAQKEKERIELRFRNTLMLFARCGAPPARPWSGTLAVIAIGAVAARAGRVPAGRVRLSTRPGRSR